MVWVVVTLLSPGIGIIVYLIAWIFIPESPEIHGADPGDRLKAARYPDTKKQKLTMPAGLP